MYNILSLYVGVSAHTSWYYRYGVYEIIIKQYINVVKYLFLSQHAYMIYVYPMFHTML